MSLGKRIKKLRRDAKLTQKDLSTKLDVDHTTVSKWEADIYEPNAETLDKLATLFSTSVDRLLGRSDELLVTQSEDQKKIEKDEAGFGRAFFGGADNYTEEELEVARAAARAAVEALRKVRNQQDNKK
ncbi:helix-turn-helix domain-containing protein [Paenibacillus spongiae]|uniref:Helix-turn-helix domain-containing protein n=1 Tax=Paenibacillus spongiae TaxID=2909671 RepID=A0ABY5S2U2_9BACL|nr:helix-turn-helix transcriptional regulator [Paenibacillus spongiae]UVI28192.1 helix-turn-helix domain-containing protein [Paenibacillus spongiae]